MEGHSPKGWFTTLIASTIQTSGYAILLKNAARILPTLAQPLQVVTQAQLQTLNSQRLNTAKLVAAVLKEVDNSGDESQEGNYRKAGRKALFIAFCWPLCEGIGYLLTNFFKVIFIELWAFLVCIQTVLWFIDESTSVPTIDL
jgi:hypothetical protein